MKSWHCFQAVLSINLYLIASEVQCQFYQEETLLVPVGSLVRQKCECGKQTRKLDFEKIGSAKIPDGRLPWLVELVIPPGSYRESYTGFEPDYPLCFGTLINLRTVLLPASCLNKHAWKHPRIKLHGIQNRSESLVEIRSTFVHPRYQGKLHNDLALIKLKKPLNHTKIVPICLPKVKKIFYPVRYPSTNNVYTFDVEIFDRLPVLEEEEDINGNETRARPCRNPNPPCTIRPCPCPNASKPKLTYALDTFVLRRWFHRKGPGYDYLQRFGAFQTQKTNHSMCHSKFPEMLQSKVLCVQQKQIKDVLKQRFDFFMKMEMGMPSMLTNTTLVKGKPQPSTTKYYLEGMRAPGRGGIPMFEARDNTTVLLKIHDYVPWIMENTFEFDYCFW